MRILTVVCGLSLLGMTSPTWSCSCMAPPPPKKSLAVSAAVFSGKVTAVKRTAGRITVTFTLSRTWKGTKGKTVEVTTASSGEACGYGFKKGTSYLVYCYMPTKKPVKAAPLMTNICTRTRPMTLAKDDLKELGPGKKP